MSYYLKQYYRLFGKAVVEISSVCFGPLCCLDSTAFFAVISVAQNNNNEKKKKEKNPTKKPKKQKEKGLKILQLSITVMFSIYSLLLKTRPQFPIYPVVS